MSVPGDNLHVYPAPIVNESRIYRMTAEVAASGLFRGDIVVCGQSAPDLPTDESWGVGRRVERIAGARADRSRSALGRIRDQLSWSRRVYATWSRRDLAVVNAHSVAVLPVCFALARSRKARLIYDTHELETETSTSRGIQRRVFKLVERALIRRCDAVLVVNESIADWYRRAYPGLRVDVVRNAPELDAEAIGVDLRATLGIPSGDRLFVHVGNIVPHRYVEEVLQAFAARGTTGDHVVFLGAGTLQERVEQVAASHANVHHHPAVPSASVVATVATADVGLCLIEPTCLSYALALPNKALEYSRAGVPFVHNRLVEVEALVAGALDGWGVETTVDALGAALDRLSDGEITAARDRMRNVELPDWRHEAGRMLDVYRRVLGLPVA